jgi:hypothetical protein
MCVRQVRPPGRGDFWILKIAHGPSDKNLSKNGSAHKGGSLSVKDVIAKKFLVPGEDSAVGASASIYGSSAATGARQRERRWDGRRLPDRLDGSKCAE